MRACMLTAASATSAKLVPKLSFFRALPSISARHCHRPAQETYSCHSKPDHPSVFIRIFMPAPCSMWGPRRQSAPAENSRTYNLNDLNPHHAGGSKPCSHREANELFPSQQESCTTWTMHQRNCAALFLQLLDGIASGPNQSGDNAIRVCRNSCFILPEQEMFAARTFMSIAPTFC